jgi:hypothetical protein
LCQQQSNPYIFGDFNIDFTTAKYQDIGKKLCQLLHFDLTSSKELKMTIISTSRNQKSKIDWIFKPLNMNEKKYCDVWLYETWFAEHRPIAFELLFDEPLVKEVNQHELETPPLEHIETGKHVNDSAELTK